MESKVSIITANYNKSAFLKETINSVLDQTYINWELIFVDDCSTDGSLELIKGDFNDDRIKSIKLEHRSGANVCRNRGVKEAKGEYIIFLDADDLLANICLEGRVKEMQSDEKLDMCVFAMSVFSKTIGDGKHVWRPHSKNPLADFLQHDLPWSIMQPIWKRKVLLELDGFDENFGRLQDVEFHTRLLFEKNINLKQFPDVIDCYYRVGDDRRSANTFDYNMPRVIGSLQYYLKFYEKAKERNLENLLLGTIYQTFHQCVYHTRTKQMTLSQLDELQSKLLDYTKLHVSRFKRSLFRLSRFYNLKLPRVPGVNHFITKLITS